ncbi:MAG: V-type ATPase subunit [Candidatus Margulisbacteria bacterium]|jgi:vacuolar-type H+-ATPase subunit C/Vma6|nr:V-type ATPase subunit [Candidatus Margulisiibacteriota bacterium]
MTGLGFLLGRVRSREGQLLSLAELGKAEFAETETLEQLENRLNQELADLRRELFRDTAVAEICWLKYDLHNLKILLKEKLIEQNLDHYLLPLGKDKLADFDQTLVRRAVEIYEKTADFCQLDYWLDQEHLRALQALAKKQDRYIQAYIHAQAAIAEYKYHYDPATAAETLRQKFPNIEIPETLDEGAVEKALEDYANKQLFAGRYGCGAAAVLAFVQAKENEIKNIKILYLSRGRALPELQNYLRHTYV